MSGGRGTVAVVIAVTIAIRGRRRGGGVIGGVSIAVVVSKVFDGALGGVGRDKGSTLRNGRTSGDLDLVLVGNLLDNLCNLATVGEDGGNSLLVHDGFTDLLRLRHCSGCWLKGDGGRVRVGGCCIAMRENGERVLERRGDERRRRRSG